MRILFVSHTRSWSGAEVAMFRLVSALRRSAEVAVAAPSDSQVGEATRRLGVRHLPVACVELSLRFDPVGTPRGLVQLARGGHTVAKAARSFGAEVIHANTLRAGLMATLGQPRLGAPLLVQCHEHLPDDPVSRGVRRVLARSAGAVVAVCDHTAENFNRGLARPVAERVYISIDQARFSPNGRAPTPIRRELALPDDVPLLAQVAQITPWKCQDVAIRTLGHLRDRGSTAHLLLVGDISFSGRAVRYDNGAYLRSLHALIADLDLHDRVHWLGWREDVPAILRAVDLSLLPSHHEPFGTSAAESMASGTPVLVSDDGGPSEYVSDGESGRVLPQGRPELWADAAHALLGDRAELARMGEAAVRGAASFTDQAYAEGMLAAYRRMIRAQ